MQMDIQCRGFDLTAGLRDYASRCLAYSLSHGDAYIRRVIIRLSDINGPRGGEDKRCHLEVRLKGGLPGVVIEDIEADLYLAINRAAERAGRTLARRLARSQRGAPGVQPEEKADQPGSVESGREHE